jgi:hypothetical protein
VREIKNVVESAFVELPSRQVAFLAVPQSIRSRGHARQGRRTPVSATGWSPR